MIFINVILPVFLMIGVGYLFQKVKSPDFKSISDLTLYFLAPCLIFEALMRSEGEISKFASKTVIFMILLTLTLWGLSYLFSKVLKLSDSQESALTLSSVMMNCGNFGLPLILFAFGEKAISYAVIVLVCFTFPLGTLAVFIASKGKSSVKKSLIEITKTPLFYSILFATAFKYFGITIPSIIMKPLILLGDAAIPTLLVLLGMQLAKTDFKINVKPVAGSCVLRLIVSPVVAFGICYILGISGLEKKVLIVQTSTPSAIIPLLFAINYGSAPEVVAGSIFFSTILSALTLTILLYLI